jgi:sulfur-carrier protein
MKVNFFATLRPVVGHKSVEFEAVAGLTVRELVQQIVQRYPGLQRELLNDAGELYPHVHVFINGRDAPYLANGMDTVLAANDTVNVFPAIAGG